MNQVEFTRLTRAVVALLTKVQYDDFRYDLTALIDLTKVNLPKRKLMDTVSDCLTLNSTVAAVGSWVVAEVEGCSVQFNKLSTHRVNADGTSIIPKTTLTIEHIRTLLGPLKYARLEVWIKQELVQEDSCDFYSSSTDEDDELVHELSSLFFANDPSLLESNEPCRTTLDKVVLLYRAAHPEVTA